MPTIAEIRQKYPQYSDMSDSALADSLYQKHYSDIPRDEFNQKIGLAERAIPVGGFVGETISNVPASAGRLVSDIAQPVIHPIETYEGVKNLTSGVAQKLGLASGKDKEKYADAMWKYLVDRYGGAEQLSNTLKTDPVGLAADVSMILTGGETAAARGPALLGETAKVMGKAGRAIDPLSLPSALASGARGFEKTSGTLIGGLTTRTAFGAGYEGGKRGAAFTESMRGQRPAEQVVEEARDALANIRKKRGDEYRQGMAAITTNPQILEFDKINKAVKEVAEVKTFKGQIISPSTQKIRTEITDTVEAWKNLPDTEFHTVEGLDALKQKIGDIRDGTQPGTSERFVADRAYQAVRKTIIEEAPEYAKVMKGYEDASDLIREMDKTLSLNPKASIDTALRKLQSVLRNNVNTNYGERARLAEYLIDNGSPHLLESLAGQASASFTPRGMSRTLGAADLVGAIGAFIAGAPNVAFGAVAGLPLLSPRITGEAAYYAGKGAGTVAEIPHKRTLARGARALGGATGLEAGDGSPLAEPSQPR